MRAQVSTMYMLRAQRRLSREVQSAVEYVQSHQLGLQRRALVMDYLPSLRAIAKSENVREAVNSKRR
jgi:hypothetical protein